LVCAFSPPRYEKQVILQFGRLAADFLRYKWEQGLASTSQQLPGTVAAAGGTAREFCW